MAFFILTRFVLVKYSRAFVERPSQGTSSLASRLTTVSLDIVRLKRIVVFDIQVFAKFCTEYSNIRLYKYICFVVIN